jgi:hypothetical protein
MVTLNAVEIGTPLVLETLHESNRYFPTLTAKETTVQKVWKVHPRSWRL